jgi:ABC-type branched-subunit amino acid transport system substrate-binding protein
MKSIAGVLPFVALIAAAVLPGACNRLGSGDSHQIGHLVPQSGPDAAEGQKLIAAIALVVDETNHDEPNRIEQRPITVIHANTGAGPEGFELQATRLLTVNRVTALLGGVNSAQLAKIIATVQAQPQAFAPITVSPCGGLGPTPNKLVFCVGLAPGERGTYLARGGVEHAKVTEVVTITDTRDAVFAAIRGGFEAEFRHADRKLGAALSLAKPEEIPELAKKVASASPKAILFCGRATDLLKLRSELNSAKFGDDVPWLFGGEEEEGVFLKDPARGGPIIYASAFTTEDKAESMQKFVTDFRTRASSLPDADAALSADAARVLFAGARNAKKFLAKALGPELAKLEMDLPTGKFWFKDGEPRRTAYVLRIEGDTPRLLARYEPKQK